MKAYSVHFNLRKQIKEPNRVENIKEKLDIKPKQRTDEVEVKWK